MQRVLSEIKFFIVRQVVSTLIYLKVKGTQTKLLSSVYEEL